MAAVQEDFFSFLAREFPTLCLHDEFIFFPRVSAAWEHWFQLPHLESGFLESAAARLAGLLSRLPRLAPQAEPGLLAEEAVLLRQSLQSVRRELGPGGSWRQDPFLYLKTASQPGPGPVSRSAAVRRPAAFLSGGPAAAGGQRYMIPMQVEAHPGVRPKSGGTRGSVPTVQ